MAGSIIPDAGVYAQGQAYAQQAYSQAKSNIATKKQGLLSQYGLSGTPDSAHAGQMAAYTVDRNNPYGSIQNMFHNQAVESNTAYDSSADRNIGHTGLGNQAESNLIYSHGAQSKALGDQFTGQMGDLAGQEAQAGTNYQQALFSAQQAALNAAIANGDFTQVPIDMSGIDWGAGDQTPSGAPPFGSDLLPANFDWSKVLNDPKVLAANTPNARAKFNIPPLPGSGKVTKPYIPPVAQKPAPSAAPKLTAARAAVAKTLAKKER